MEIVPVSFSKIIVKLKPDKAIAKVKNLFDAYNQSHGASIRRLRAFDGKLLWSEHAHAPPNHTSKDISRSIELSLQNASSKMYKELITTLLSSAQHAMTQDGFAVGTLGIIAEWSSMRRRRAGLVKVTFPSATGARAFHYKHKDYEWASDDGTQTMIVHLKHDIIDQELCSVSIRRALGSMSKVTLTSIESITTGLAN